MIKIKILLFFFISVILIQLSSFIWGLFIVGYEFLNPGDIWVKLNFIYGYISGTLTIIGLSLCSIGLLQLIKKGLFNSNGFKKIRWGSYLFIGIAILDTVRFIYNLDIKNNTGFWIQSFFCNCLILTLGFVGLIISDVIASGKFIKTENDLTI